VSGGLNGTDKTALRIFEERSHPEGVELTHKYYPSLSLAALEEIISDEKIVVHFQSILSARNHSIIGFEGLIRGKSPDGGLIPPISLFHAARQHDLTLELDRLCREKVLAGFSNIYHLQQNSLLFLNLETSFLSSEIVGSGYLLNQVIRHKVPPANIIIEIVESRTDDTDALIQFVNNYRDCGLNIALDDVGTGHSNFDRISLLRPNVIKVDRSIIKEITTNYFKQEIFKSLTNLSRNIGSLTLAEGVETREEVLKCIEYGADLLQGYYFSRPKDITYPETDGEERKLEDILLAIRAGQIDIVRARRLETKRYQKIAQRIVCRLRNKLPEAFDAVLLEIIEASDSIDALYIISDNGIQMTDTFLKEHNKRLINPVFRAVNKNENLSHKDYFYHLINTDLKKYTTGRYISFATGNLCVTLSHLFRGKDNRRYILCTDFLAGDRPS
jgi:EAL domain-containing protein (putative c-di-GMP-specific phosphodiesterase class I)